VDGGGFDYAIKRARLSERRSLIKKREEEELVRFCEDELSTPHGGARLKLLLVFEE
jgi:hypothetical protein